MKIAIINGPNLNLLGKREPKIYGTTDFEQYLQTLQQQYQQTELHYFQSNIEGELINYIQSVGFSFNGIIINPGGYTHTSVAIGDCIKAITTPVIEVHISNVHAREPFRQINHVSASCKGSIIGLGLKGYALAIEWFLQ
jgi:3-dehydroquinate dehydratase II